MRGERKSVVLDLAGNSMRVPGNVISTLRLMYCSSFARSVRAAAFFTMISYRRLMAKPGPLTACHAI